MRAGRTLTVYAALAAAWGLICGWQMLEHRRVADSARASLVARAGDISYTLGAVIRSLGPAGLVLQPQLETALEGLAKSSELQSIALLNSTGQVVVSAGKPIEPDIKTLVTSGGRWDTKTVSFVNLIDLGFDDETADTSRPATIVVSPPGDNDASRPLSLFPPPPMRRGPPRMGREGTENPPDLDDEGFGPPGGQRRGRGGFRRGGMRGPGPGPGPRFGRPFQMDEDRYKELLQKQGLYGFVLVMSTGTFEAETGRDRWLRMAIATIALIAVSGLGLAWRNIERSARLQLRLVRAGEMNLHLQEMNLAAAGLAHETRNPLNIVRGLAQMIAKQSDVSPEIRKRSVEITDEVDRVTGRLDEFMDYSRPREPRLAPTHFPVVVRDVERALESDKEDKAVEFQLSGPELRVQADESMLRQLIFNLLLNAIQAVDPHGRVEVVMEKNKADEAAFEVRDDGPGVPLAARENIFRPYFTTRRDGTGLGLSVVRQIALAHGWDIEYTAGEAGGARFRVSGLKLAPKVQ